MALFHVISTDILCFVCVAYFITITCVILVRIVCAHDGINDCIDCTIETIVVSPFAVTAVSLAGSSPVRGVVRAPR